MSKTSLVTVRRGALHFTRETYERFFNSLDNVVLLPHVGSATARTRTAMATLAMRNLEEFLTSGQLVTPV